MQFVNRGYPIIVPPAYLSRNDVRRPFRPADRPFLATSIRHATFPMVWKKGGGGDSGEEGIGERGQKEKINKSIICCQKQSANREGRGEGDGRACRRPIPSVATLPERKLFLNPTTEAAAF